MNSQKLSVLLVEDEIHSRDLLLDYISSRPELILRGIARDGQEAFEKLKEESFDIVLWILICPS